MHEQSIRHKFGALVRFPDIYSMIYDQEVTEIQQIQTSNGIHYRLGTRVLSLVLPLFLRKLACQGQTT